LAEVSPFGGEKKMSSEMRTVTILGSTGSVGSNTVELVEREPERFSVEALVANRNVAKLAEQAKRLHPRLVVVAEDRAYGPLKEALAGSGIEIAAGADAVVEAAARPADWVMAAIVGAAGLKPTLAAIQRGAMIGLANKETLVCAGSLVMAEVARCGATVIPVDSEHSAVFQVLDTAQRDRIDKIILTASGGPFRTFTAEMMAPVTPEQAVAHPNWDMGAKISVDSASMMNKGLELIEAYHLFGLPEDRIDILVHPQSVVHSMVSYVDGSVLAQLGTPDMRTPISLALGWPKRMATPGGDRLDLARVGTLTFEAPDPVRFPALRLARDVLRKGGAAPTILNAANEVAVQAFLDRKIGFLDIVRLVEQVVETLGDASLNSLEDVLICDTQARRVAGELVIRITQ
jgi:1-deoxy-D-xylulose-5-phosphate reductoisomerase